MDTPTNEQIRTWGKQILASDRGAFDRLFRSMYPRLVRFARRYHSRKAIADDIVQDAFVSLWDKREYIDPEQSLKAYLYTMVRNKSLNHIRDHADEKVGLDDERLLKTTDPSHPDGDNGQLKKHLYEWIKELPDRQREAFELSRFEGLDHDEIASVMDVSPSTVNNHIVAALSTLRDRYEEYKQNKIDE